MTGKRLGDFEIIEEIGRGGMGQVYRARQISLDRDVAIKILPGNLGELEEFRERFDVEAKAVASLVHENILQMYSKGVTDEGIHYFAMEYVDGEDLGSMLKKGTAFSEKEAVGIAVQICRGLEAAWRRNIIHRDIKPSNIIITKTGTVKIADFGLAKSLDATKKLTQTNMYMGTVAYISPEQGEGKPLDHRTDIYSLGIVLYQLLTGSVPFKAETPSSVIYKHVYEAPPPPRSVNPAISSGAEETVLKAIAKKPEDRFQDPVRFREALESLGKPGTEKKQEFQKPSASPVGQTPSAPAAETKASKVPILIFVLVVVLLIAGSGIYAWIYGHRTLLSRVSSSTAPVSKTIDSPPKSSSSPVSSVGASATQTVGPAANNVQGQPRTANMPPVVPAKKENEKAGDASGHEATPTHKGNVAPGQLLASKRAALPTVMVVTSGETNLSDIVESVIGKKMTAGSIPLSAPGELQALSDSYGRHGIPLGALERHRPKADVLVYVTISTMDAAPLHFYGHTAEQYASTISIKVIDTTTGKVVTSPRPKTVNYTTLNMQDNIEEATEEMVTGLPGKIKSFWQSGAGSS